MAQEALAQEALAQEAQTPLGAPAAVEHHLHLELLRLHDIHATTLKITKVMPGED
jgi:hypothetical protein